MRVVLVGLSDTVTENRIREAIYSLPPVPAGQKIRIVHGSDRTSFDYAVYRIIRDDDRYMDVRRKFDKSTVNSIIDYIEKAIIDGALFCIVFIDNPFSKEQRGLLDQLASLPVAIQLITEENAELSSSSK